MIIREEDKGMREDVGRVFKSFRDFIGENRVYPPGEILCVSTRNNEEYNLFLMADGHSDFKKLFAKNAIVKGGGDNIIVTEEDDGNTLRIKIE